MREKHSSSRSNSCCLFCGRPWGEVSKSREHVLGQWMRKHESELLARPQVSYQAGFDLADDAEYFIELPTSVVTRKAALLTLKTREVCKDCNTIWMNKLEQLAEPLILRMVEAARIVDTTILSKANAEDLGRWAQKTALTFELTSASRRVANVKMGRQLRSGSPLRGAMVWAARHPQDYDLGIGFVHIDISRTPDPQPGPPDRQVLLVGIVYHFMTVLVYITDAPGQLPPPIPLDGWQLIWPAFGPVEFPPMRVVHGTEVREILTNHSAWLPLVNHKGIRRLLEPPQISHRN